MSRDGTFTQDLKTASQSFLSCGQEVLDRYEKFFKTLSDWSVNPEWPLPLSLLKAAALIQYLILDESNTSIQDWPFQGERGLHLVGLEGLGELLDKPDCFCFHITEAISQLGIEVAYQFDADWKELDGALRLTKRVWAALGKKTKIGDVVEWEGKDYVIAYREDSSLAKVVWLVDLQYLDPNT